ncbi:UPF0415 protein C7orf25 homolog isoform X2 [Orussus abietinus]|nr:UPF0415 protein C7orf25 homolog isoform X2 [Orussus abietinus]
MVNRLLSSTDPVGVMKPFKFQKSRLEVDVVCDGGSSWVKVIARNARALTLISLGAGEYGQKSVLDQADSFLECAKHHPYHYKFPKIIFHFAYGIETPLAARLERLGVDVEGERISSDYDEDSMNSIEVCEDMESDELFNPERSMESSPDLEVLNTKTNSTEIKTLNLDVSTLLAFVTNMTNGHANFVYREPLLTRQAEWERARPVKPILDELFGNKELVVCRTAYNNFMNIIEVIGGSNETMRAEKLIQRVRIVEDISNGRIMERLPIAGRIKDRSRLVFSTGENLQSITVSANEGFVRAARMQGIECTVFLHEPRSLSEVKEAYATRLRS